MCCFVISLRLVLRVFFNSPTQFHLCRDWVMCCSLWFLFVFGLKSIFQQSYPISTYESRDWVMCCSFVIPFFVFGLKSIFQQSYPISTYESRIEWCAALLWFFFLRLVLEYFSTVLPNFYLWKQGLSDVLLWFLSRLVFRVFFQQSYPISPMKAGIEWCAALCDSFFTFGLKSIFQQSYPISTYESRDWVMCCSLWFLSLRLVLRVFFNSPTQFLPMKAGIEWCAAPLWFFLYVWS
jgi:hypothetical protein